MTEPATAPATTATEAAAPTAAVVTAARHVRSAERFATLKLDWPIEMDGRIYDHVTVTRMNVKQLASYMETMATDNGLAALPMYDVPRSVIEALDADDGGRLDEVVARFLPQAFRGTNASTPSSGGNISQSQPSDLADKASSG